jgi:formate dehydrogenase major subunit
MAEGVEQTKWGSIKAEERTMRTNLENVFSGGDCVSGADIAVTAVAAGRRVAIAIDQYLAGQEVLGDPVRYNHSMGKIEEVPKKSVERFDSKPRTPMPHLDPAKRVKTFAEVETGFAGEAALAEAKRCMECGCRDAHECRLRTYATLFDADQKRYVGDRREFERDDSHPEIVYEAHKCILCGTCVRLTEEILGTSAIGFAGRGFSSRVKPALGRPLALVSAKGLETIVDGCPVGALTLKSARVATLEAIFDRPTPMTRP